MNFKVLTAISVLVLSIILNSSCSVSAIKPGVGVEQKIEKINLGLVRFFNPAYEPARANEFEHKDRKLTCEKPISFWKRSINFTQARLAIDCLNSTQSGVATFNYESTGRIYLKLNPHEKEQPECLKKTLPEINLPREVYFYGLKEGETQQDSYEMSFNVNTNQVLDAELREARVSIEVHFPLGRILRNAEDLNLWLTTLVFSVFRSEGGLRASIVTENVSNQCFSDEPLFFDKKIGKLPPVFWP